MNNATLGGLSFTPDDIVMYDPDSDMATLVFEGTPLFGQNRNIDAFSLLATGHFLLSTTDNATLSGVSFKDGDIIEYDPSTGMVTLFFGEALFTQNEDIDAVSLFDNGYILLSTDGNATLGGLTFRDGDLVAYDFSTAMASLFFDEDLFGNNQQVNALSLLPNGNLLLSVNNNATLGGLNFGNGDVVEYNFSTGMASLFFDEDLFSGDENIDAFYVLVESTTPVPEPNTLLLLGSCCLGFLVYRVWRRQQATDMV